MANSNTAYGLRPVGLVGSASNSTGVTQYEIASNNTNDGRQENRRTEFEIKAN